MKRWVLGNVLAMAWLGTPIFAADFVDPAPPVVSAILPRAIREPTTFAELTFHAPPRPLAKDAVTTDWPGYFGSANVPASTETRLLKTFPEKFAPVWEVRKGAGYAAPAILGGRLVLFHRVGDEAVIDCLHRESGRRFWQLKYPTTYDDRYGWSNGPRCMPVIDAKTGLVFTLGADGQLHAIDLATGQILWQRNILKDFKLEANFFGVGATPLVEGDDLIINVGAPGACVVGFDIKTGKARWAAAAPRNWGPSYAAAVAATVHGLRRVFVFAGGESRPPTGGLLCIEPGTGKVDFTFPWRGKRFESVNASAPLIVGHHVFISECYGRGGTMLQLSREGDRLSAKPLWHTEDLGTHFMTALHLDGHLYGVHGHGPADAPLICLDAATGQTRWSEEPDLSETLTPRNGTPRRIRLNTCLMHLLSVDGGVLGLTEWGHLLKLDLSPRGVKIAARKMLFYSGESWTPPVLSRGLLYIHQNTPDRTTGTPPRMICYDLRG